MCREHVQGHGVITVVVLLRADYGPDIVLSTLHALFHLIINLTNIKLLETSL